MAEFEAIYQRQKEGWHIMRKIYQLKLILLTIFLSLYVFAYSAPAFGAQVTYCSHIANVGWLSWVSDGQTSGSPGFGNQMEAVQIKTVGFPSTYHIDYQAHVSYIGWQGWVSDGQTAGTTGQGKAIEAIQIKLRGFPSNYHVKYRAYIQNIGWQGWVSDGATAGTTGQGKVLEAIQISIIYSVNPTIAMSPMSGLPGTTFTEWGTGFTPNSTATLHFRKPDGTEHTPIPQGIDSIGHFEIIYTAPIDKEPGTHTWWGIDDSTGIKSNEVSYEIIPIINPTIAMSPMSGLPGTTFTEWGTGFTPNSTATLHFRKPDGTEHTPIPQGIDSIGHFEIIYTAPIDKEPGTHTWWGIDDSTGIKSNEVSYEITPLISPTIAMSPMSGLPGTIFTVNGGGFTPNSTVTSHLKKPDGTEFPILQIPTYGQGEYTWPIDSTEFVPGDYQHWVFDDATGTRSNTVGFSVEATQINEADLVKGSGPEVYYIQNNLKRHIPDPETFNILQFEWATIKPVSDSLLVSYDEGDPAPPLRNSMLIKRGQEIHVYIIESGQKRWIPDESTLYSLGRRFDEVIPVEAVFFDLIRLGVPIPSSTTPPLMTPSAASANFGLDSTSGYAADPVNTALGNFTYQHTDLKMPGRGLFFEFTRTYNSADTYSGPLGAGWTHSYNIVVTEKLLNEMEDQVFVKWGDGHEDFYTYSSGSYMSEFGHDILIKDGNLLELTTREQIRYRFVPVYSVEFFDDNYNVITSVSWRLLDIQDRNGNTILLSYDDEGKLIEITDTVGRVVRLYYDGDGKRIDNIIDTTLGRTVELYYTKDDLTKVKDLGGRYTSFAYDEVHHLTSITDAREHSLVTNEYDDNGKVKTQTDAKGYRTTYEYYEADKRTIVTDSLGNNTTYLHDERNRLVQTIDALSTTNKYTYDQKNNRTFVTDKRENITEYTYDTSGNVLTKTDALKNVTSITYDSNNNPITREDALGNVTAFEYDANGNLIKTTNALNNFTTTIYNVHGQPQSVTDYKGNTSSYNYDAKGNLVSVTDTLDNTISYTYDDVGRRRTRTDALDRITKYSYDNNDNLLSVTDPLGNIVSSTFDENDNNLTDTDAMDNTTRYTYDVKDLVESVTDPLDNSTEYTYDGLDRKISATDKNGNATTYSYDEKGNLVSIIDALNNSTIYTYDPNGNRLSETDPLGQGTTYTYDAMNRVASIIDPLGNMTTNTYDDLGRVTATTNAKSQTTDFEHDVLGRLVKVTDAEEGVLTYIYDENGNRLSMIDPNGNTTSYTYNAVNRLIRKTEAMGSTYRYAYDAQGNMTSHVDANGNTVSYTYDVNDRLVKITYPDASTVRFTYDANGNRTSMLDSLGETSYTYDSLKRLTSYADPFGKSVGYGYDPNGNRTSITYPGGKAVNYSYDSLNQLIWVTDWLSNKTNYAYNAAGRLTNILNPNNTTATYTYDTAGRLTQLLNAKSDQTVISSYTYTLDALGNHIQVVKDEPLAITLADSNITYTYDA